MFTLRRPRSAGDPKGPKPIYALRRPQGAGDPKGPKPICNLRRPRSAGDPKGPKPNLLEGGTPTLKGRARIFVDGGPVQV